VDGAGWARKVNMQISRIKEIEELTGLVFCDENCPCGNNDQLFKTVPGNDVPDWLPDWMNCAEPESVGKWLIDNGKLSSPTVQQAENKAWNVIW
jgi:hypothetical protein